MLSVYAVFRDAAPGFILGAHKCRNNYIKGLMCSPRMAAKEDLWRGSLPQSPGHYQWNGVAMALSVRHLQRQPVLCSGSISPRPSSLSPDSTLVGTHRIWTPGGSSCGLSKGLLGSVSGYHGNPTGPRPGAPGFHPGRGWTTKSAPTSLFAFISSQVHRIWMGCLTLRQAEDLVMNNTEKVLAQRTCVLQWRQTQTDK